MPIRTACPIAPSAAERVRLKKMAYGHKTEHRLRVRAQVVLHATRGRSNARIARETGLHLDTVRRWRGRFAQVGLPGLKDRRRCGRPASFTPLQLPRSRRWPAGCPAETGVPISRWSCPELAREAALRGIAAFVSASTVRRWLDQDALKPWPHRSWIFRPVAEEAPEPENRQRDRTAMYGNCTRYRVKGIPGVKDRSFDALQDAKTWLAQAQTDARRGEFVDPRDGAISLKEYIATPWWPTQSGDPSVIEGSSRGCGGTLFPIWGLSRSTPSARKSCGTGRSGWRRISVRPRSGLSGRHSPESSRPLSRTVASDATHAAPARSGLLPPHPAESKRGRPNGCWPYGRPCRTATGFSS
ncbi:helix-turn-helix domain-containing protein [Streptomyces celluloflavus]|uniref:helix-turn-helix domain-containing protein n=1 Tax=Streptomyces celluloflavus TaxID=58344 RepID=UPI003461118A|nr:helix-turn-helix domain-containing protein [Streptomyces celluloflavus]